MEGAGIGSRGARVSGKMQRTLKKLAYVIRGLISMMPAATLKEPLPYPPDSRQNSPHTITFNPQNSLMWFINPPLTAAALCCFQIWTLVTRDVAEVRPPDTTWLIRLYFWGRRKET